MRCQQLLCGIGLLGVAALSCGGPESTSDPKPTEPSQTKAFATPSEAQTTGALPADWDPAGFPKVNAHESLYSYDQLKGLRRVNGRFNIAHTVLIGHFKGTFREGSKWDKEDFAPANNEFVLDLAAKFPDEFSAICMVNPCDPKVFERIRDYVDRGAIGVQVYAWMFRGGLDSPVHDPFFQYLESRQVPLSLRTGVARPPGLHAVDTVLNKHPFLKVLIPHYMVSEDVPEHVDYLLRKHDHLYFDVSYGFKKWRTDHFQRISRHIDPLRELIVQFPDRVLFGTDIVVGTDAWKTQAYVEASFADYIAMLECKAFPFSLKKMALNGFAFEQPILEKLYQGNFEALFGQRPSPRDPETLCVTRVREDESASLVERARVLLALVANPFSPTKNVPVTDGRFAFPPSTTALYADRRLEELAPAFQQRPAYLERELVFAKVAKDKDALGLVFFGDLSPKVKLLAVNGVSLLGRRLRAAPSKLDEYPLAVPVASRRVAPQDVFNPYHYFSILITGCSLIGQGLNERNVFHAPEALAGGIRAVMRDADITHLSNETSFVPDGVHDEKRFTFCTEIRNFNLLPYLGIDVVGLTGNHLLDFGRPHFVSTLDQFSRFHIGYFGGGRRDDLSEYAYLVDLFGTHVAFVGYNDISGSRGLATQTLAGSTDLRLDKIEADLARVREHSDVIVVDYQAGNEFAPEPTYFQRRVAALSAKSGANAVHFLHSHSRKGFEFFGDCPAFYGPGNFLFFHPSENFNTSDAYIVKYHFDKARLVQCEMIPIHISDHDVGLGDDGAMQSYLQGLHGDRNTKSPLHAILAPDAPGKQEGIGRWPRLAEHFSITPVRLGNVRLVSPDADITVALDAQGPALIDGAGFLLNGDASILENERVFLLFTFRGLAELDAFKEALQNDPERLRNLFCSHGAKIVFGARLFDKPDCRSRSAQYFFRYQLLTTYRNLLERDRFPWPWWRFCGREWSYDYRKEVSVRGLDLPEDVLEKIYRGNMERLLKMAGGKHEAAS